MSALATVELIDGATLHYPERSPALDSQVTELPPWADDPDAGVRIFVNPFSLLDGACN
jgi:hypothetical protein